MKKQLLSMLEALINNNNEEAIENLHTYLSSKTRNLVLGEKKDEDDEKDEEKEDENEDEDEDENEDEDDGEKAEKKAEKKEKKAIKNLVKAQKEEDKAEKMEEGQTADDRGSQYHSYRHNEKGEAYHKVPHKDNSMGYGYEKSRSASRKQRADSSSGYTEKTRDAYKDVVHKDNSRSAKSEDKGRKGLKQASQGVRSPYSDGNKENRRMDKAKGYHGMSRDGKELPSS